MNWSTRLRRWVRIRMPPVREASTKPTAATVLPAPVACSNQKRRLAPGSSGASATTSVVLGLLLESMGSSSQSLRLLVLLGELVVVDLVGVVLVLGFGSSSALVLLASGSLPSPLTLDRAGAPRARRSARRGCPRARRPGARSSSAPSSSFGGVLGEDALEPEQEGVVAAPLHRRRPRGPRRSRRARRRGPCGGRVPGARSVELLAFEQERLARELTRASDLDARPLRR